VVSVAITNPAIMPESVHIVSRIVSAESSVMNGIAQARFFLIDFTKVKSNRDLI
jgi:hypothetical protein